MRRASYREALAWIAGNDDTSFMNEEPNSAADSLSVTGALVVDLFGVGEAKFRADLRRELARQAAVADEQQAGREREAS